MLPRTVLHSLAFALIFGLFLFVPAGTFAWPQAWVFMALFIGCSESIDLWLTKNDRVLLANRMKSPLSVDQKPRARAVVSTILVAFFAWIAFMGLDARRFHWSHSPFWAEILGAVLIISAFFGWIGVMKANIFAASTARFQRERGQTVISTGPYAVVRYPIYAYFLPLMIGAPLLLGSLWGLLGILLFLPLLAARILGEEARLMDALPGYREYAAKVTFRILPGLW